MEKFEKNRFSLRIENLKSVLVKAISMGFFTYASLFSLNANGQEVSKDDIFEAIKNNEKNIREMTFEEKKVLDDKPSFILTGESELMDVFNKYNKNKHDSIYEKTNGVDDFSAGVVETMLLNSSKSEDFYIIQSNPNTIKIVLNQYKQEASSGAYDSETINKPTFSEGSHYYIVFSVDQNEYKARIFDTGNGLVDTVTSIKLPDQSLLENLENLTDILGKKIETLK